MAKAKRGEIWLIDLGLAQKVRPCLILSVDFLDHERAVVTYVPRTTSLRNTRFEVPHTAPQFEPGAFDAQGIGTVPVVKLMVQRGVIASADLAKIEEAVRQWLSL